MGKFAVLLCSSLVLLLSTAAFAETQETTKAGSAAPLKLKVASIFSLSDSREQTETRSEGPGSALQVRLNEGMQAFCDFASPWLREVRTKKDDPTDRRAVVGFRFPIQ